MTDSADDRLHRDQRGKLRRSHLGGPPDTVAATPLDRAAVPATEPLGLVEPVRTESGGRIRRSSSGMIQRELVSIEEVVDDEPASKGPQIPREIEQPSTPLLLTDRPWAEIEAERAEKAKQRIADDKARVEREAAEKAEREREATAAREVDQQSDPKWQQKMHTLNRPMGDVGVDKTAPIDNEKFRRRGRELKDTLADQRGKQVAEQKKIDDEKERVAAEQKRLADEEAERQLQADDLVAEPTVKPLVEPVQARSKQALIVAKVWGVNSTRLQSYNRKLTGLLKISRWSQIEDVLDEISDEASRVASISKSVEVEQDRAQALNNLSTTPRKRVIEIVAMYTKFRQLSQAENKDAETTAALVALQSAIQAEEDKAAAKDAATQAKIALRTEGLWPGNNNAAAVIAKKTRADVGDSDEERTAVVEALDALKDSTKDHSFARKWNAPHGNGEGNLPGTPGLGGYTEYYVRKAPTDHAPGPRRLVRHTATGFVYYSKNHYGQGNVLPAFVKVTDA